MAKQTHIQGLNTQKPREFWREINKLGPGGSSNPTPKSVRLANGDITSDTQRELEKWKNDFKQLYDYTGHTDAENQNFLAQVERLSSQWEAEYQATLDATTPATSNTIAMQQASEMLNRPITLPETINAIKHTKDGKAVGVDNVTNEILKVTALQECLHRLYAACFEHSVVPAKWYLRIIHPILKKGQDPLMSINHRGITLMSSICKVFSSIINSRLVLYMEINDIFADEQNGFRKLRSCPDHIFALTTIVRNRKQKGLSTYCCFVDFAKAFDSVNYPCLWYKFVWMDD